MVLCLWIVVCKNSISSKISSFEGHSTPEVYMKKLYWVYFSDAVTRT